MSARAARFPWWALAIAIGLVILLYSFATSNLYRRVVQFVTDNPQVTTTRFARVGYEVRNADGSVRTVRGTLTAQDEASITVETQREVRTTIMRWDLGEGGLVCASPNADGSCPLGQPVSLERVSFSGSLILEDLGKYQVIGDSGEQKNILKVATEGETRTPAACRPNTEGSCRITLRLLPNAQGNVFNAVLLLDTTADSITVQEVPPLIEVLQRADIVQELNFQPEQCALNNLAGCDEGPFLTLFVTFGSFLLACALGLGLGLMRISANPLLTNVATIYVEVVRGVPLLVVLLFFNYVFGLWFRDEFPLVAPTLMQGTVIVVALVGAFLAWRGVSQRLPPLEIVQPVIVVAAVGGGVVVALEYFRLNSTLSPVSRAMIGLGIGYGAFLAELFRAGIQSVGRGQMEAARSLGMTYVQAMRYVILPQAFRVVLPPLGNEFIAILKDTSLLAALAIPELTYRGRLFAADTLQVFAAYISIGAIYLCMTLFLSFLIRTVERRVRIAA